MQKDVEKVLSDANDYVENELTHVHHEFRDAAVRGRTARYIRLAENKVINEYYKENGQYFDNKERKEAYLRNIMMFFVYATIACLINLIFYVPVYYLLTSWAGVNKHDAIYFTLIINTAIGAISTGIWNEGVVKNRAFIAGMRAEADNHIVGKYHRAKDEVDTLYRSKGHLEDDGFEWGA